MDKLLYVDLPNEQEREEILRTISKNSPLAFDVNLKSLASDSRCHFFSGADLSALLREAALASLREQLSQDSSSQSLSIGMQHFDAAF